MEPNKYVGQLNYKRWLKGTCKCSLELTSGRQICSKLMEEEGGTSFKEDTGGSPSFNSISISVVCTFFIVLIPKRQQV